MAHRPVVTLQIPNDQPDTQPMKMLRIVAAGALGYFAYRAWKRDGETRRALSSRAGGSFPDDGSRNPAHGDPMLDLDEADAASAPRTGTHPAASSSIG